MKLRDLYRINSKWALFVSLTVHFGVLFLLATATIQLTTPEGFVTEGGGIELSDSGSGGVPQPVEIKEAKVKRGDVPVAKEPEPQKAPKPVIPTDTNEQLEEVKVADTPKMKDADIPKNWIPVEETDVEDHGQESEKQEPQQEAQGLQEGTDEENTDGDGGDGEGLVRSEQELNPRPGNPAVSYPLMARIQRQEGTVVLRFTLNSNGSINKIWVHQTSGHKILDDAAMKTKSLHKFETGVDGIIQTKVVFSLKGPPTKMPIN